MDWLEKVAVHHREYVRWIISWGEYEFAEDLVQEMYIRLYNYSAPDKFIDNDIVNKFYVWRTLYNMFQTFQKDKSKIEKIRIGEGFDISVEDIDNIKAESYDRLCNKMYESIDSLDWYDSMMFELITSKGISMHQFAKDTGISFWSVYNTMRKAQRKLKEQIGEDYEDYRNKDYERV